MRAVPLERRVCVVDEVHEVRLEPLAGLRGVLGGAFAGAHEVEARAVIGVVGATCPPVMA